MSVLQCVRATRLLQRRRSGLTVAERLRLEEHLTGCAECAAQAQTLRALTRVVETGSPAPRPSRHERAITRAINAASEAELAERPAAPPRWGRFLVGGAVAAAAAVGLFAYASEWGGGARTAESPAGIDPSAGPERPPASARAPEPAPAGPAAPPEAPGDRITAGEARVDGVALEAGAAIEPGARLATGDGAELALAHARVTLAAGGEVMWSPRARTLDLEIGSVRASVDPAVGEPFRIATDEFVVEVLGTAFEVTGDSVRVERGTVRVVAPGGEVLAAAVEAGETWTLPRAPESRPTPPRPDPSALLARARSRLATGDVDGARQLIGRATAARPSRLERAEAETLRAECALVAGNREGAARRYRRVAESYVRSSAGENALFAAARLEADLGRRDRARELFELYLDRYPTGRLRADAEARLEEL